MADLLKANYNVQHATGLRAFTGNLRGAIGKRASAQLKYFNSYAATERGDIDVLLCDEAHRIRESSNNRFTRRSERSQRTQIDELIGAAKVSVFFIDDKQVVRPGEVGSSLLIREAAITAGAHLREQELKAQFRCNGSDEFIDWVDELLNIRSTDQFEYDTAGDFQLKIFDSPEQLERAIKTKAMNRESARLTAGFCWKWSRAKDGILVDDVVIGDYKRPWNARPESVTCPVRFRKATTGQRIRTALIK